MTALLDERLRDLATQTHLLETKVSSLGWMAGTDTETLKLMTILACIAYSCFCESFDLDPTHPIKAWRRGL